MGEAMEIRNPVYWFKVTGFLQHNWAVIEPTDSAVLVYFFDDRKRVFDQMRFTSESAAEAGLRRNGFSRYADDPKAQEFIGEPEGEFRWDIGPRPVYSSGEYWVPGHDD